MTAKYNWLRWIGVFPCSVLVFLFIYLSIRVWVRTETSTIYGIMDVVAPAIAGIAAAYCYMWAGVKIAPDHKKHTALVLLIIMILSIGASLYVEINNRSVIRIIENTFSILGLIIAYKEVEKKNIE